ncbi:hypothetical protein PR048_020093 [Dryococelus australis]|uniref:Uncharacterized protein n=1 Tax=Dryococelus australis TaxID=614101 RepID=A0ABQ9H5B9_9NEOP|nr:hypothetical protein PR048_020093 [Dryococelus australis]
MPQETDPTVTGENMQRSMNQILAMMTQMQVSTENHFTGVETALQMYRTTLQMYKTALQMYRIALLKYKAVLLRFKTVYRVSAERLGKMFSSTILKTERVQLHGRLELQALVDQVKKAQDEERKRRQNELEMVSTSPTAEHTSVPTVHNEDTRCHREQGKHGQHQRRSDNRYVNVHFMGGRDVNNQTGGRNFGGGYRGGRGWGGNGSRPYKDQNNLKDHCQKGGRKSERGRLQTSDMGGGTSSDNLPRSQAQFQGGYRSLPTRPPQQPTYYVPSQGQIGCNNYVSKTVQDGATGKISKVIHSQHNLYGVDHHRLRIGHHCHHHHHHPNKVREVLVEEKSVSREEVLQEVQKLVKAYLFSAARKRKEKFKSFKLTKFEMGTIVLVRTNPISKFWAYLTKMLYKLYEGPKEICKVLKENCYGLRNKVTKEYLGMYNVAALR